MMKFEKLADGWLPSSVTMFIESAPNFGVGNRHRDAK
jgi:hypothetical protein